MSEKVRGPASYFPSIEKTDGRPIDDGFALLEARRGLRHKEMVEVLKTEHGMGHGHASAIVAVFRQTRGMA